MPFSAGYNTVVKFGTLSSEIDLTGMLDTADLSQMVQKLDTTVFGLTAKAYIPGLAENGFKAGGNFDNATAISLEAKLQVADQSFILAPIGTGTGNRKYSSTTAFLTKFDVKSQVNNKVSADIEICISGAITRGVY